MTLQTLNFGTEKAIVGSSNTMCEEATNQPILQPDGP